MKLGRKKLRKKPVILKSMPALNFHRLLPIICLQKRISNIHTKTVFLHFLTVVFFYKPQQLIVHNSDAIASFCCVAAPCCSSKGHCVAPGRCGWRDAFFWPKSRKMEAGARKSRHTKDLQLLFTVPFSCLYLLLVCQRREMAHSQSPIFKWDTNRVWTWTVSFNITIWTITGP